MKQTHLSKLFGFIAGTLIAGSGLQAQIGPLPPISPPNWPPGPGPTPIGWQGVRILATDPTALGGTSSGAFTVLLPEPPTNDLPVYLAISGSAENGVDYQLMTNGVQMGTSAGTNVVIPAGFLAVDILVQPITGTSNTGNKTVVLTVETNASYQVMPWGRRATVTIVDDIFNILPPSVEVTNPPDGSLFWYPATITLGAEASDTDASIVSVSFFANDDFVGKATTVPYSVVWKNPRPGRYAVAALAFNSVGQSTLSAPVHLVVTNVLPTVVLSSPTNYSNFPLGTTITLEADSSDAVNPITNVTFYANAHVVDSVAIPTSATSPYTNTFAWTPTHGGPYVLQASVTDSLKNKVYSKVVVINVSRY